MPVMTEELETPPDATKLPRPATPEEVAVARARAMPNRLVVIEQVYFQSGTNDPVASEARYERRLTTDDLPYPPPRIEVTEEPLLLTQAGRDGWLGGQNVGMVHLRNEGPGVLVLCLNDHAQTPLFLVRPGESFRGEPLNLAGIVLKCPGSRCKVKYTLFPG